MPKRSAANKVYISQAALVCAEAFQKLAEKLIPRIWTVKEGITQAMPDEMGDVVACATNLAFALELYLKALLTQLDLPVPQVHDLRSLYDAIPQPVRTLIESVYDAARPDDMRRMGGRVSFTYSKGPLEEAPPPWDDYNMSLALPDLLARSKDLFQSWRYVFEFSQPEGSSFQFHQFEYGPLRCAAEVMRVEVTVRLRGMGVGFSPERTQNEPTVQ